MMNKSVRDDMCNHAQHHIWRSNQYLYNSRASYYQDDMFDFAISRTHLVDFHGPRQIYRFLSTRIFREQRLFHRGTVENKQKKWIKDTNLNWSFSNMYTPNCFDVLVSLVSIYVESIQHPTPPPPRSSQPTFSRWPAREHIESEGTSAIKASNVSVENGGFPEIRRFRNLRLSHHFFGVHHGKLTWNLKMGAPWKRRFRPWKPSFSGSM